MSQGKAEPIRDLARPRLPFPLRAINTLGGPLAPALISLEEGDLLDVAQRRTGLKDYGDESFREPLGVLLKAIREEAHLSAFGRFSSRRLVIQLLSTRLILQDLLNRHPEIREERIERPIIISGLPRTGTTHLHNLMSRDPALRYIPYWESLEPFLPPGQRPGAGKPDPRLKRCEQAIRFITYIMPLFPSMHEMTVEGPHEEIQFLAAHFSSMLFETTYHIPGYRDWYKSADQTDAYNYMKLIFQALQWQDGETKRRWVLKSPQHLEQSAPLLKVFPDACIVQTHRDPVRITASLCVMIAYAQRMNGTRVDPFAIGRYWADRGEDLLRASVDQRHLIPGGQVTDVRFHEYMADQLGTLRRVYDFAGQPFTEEAARAVEAFIRDNPKGKHGTVLYRLEDVGIDPVERRQALKFYQEFFGVPNEGS